MQKCCKNQRWKYIADASHADGCEFTYGICASCGAHLIHLYHAAIGDEGYFEIVDQAFIDKMLELKGKALKNYMREWYYTL